MAGRPPGLSLGLKKPIEEENENSESQGGPVETPIKEYGPLKPGETLEDMFPVSSSYRSEVFFKIHGGKRIGIRKIARKGKFGNWRDEIFRTTRKELDIYKRIIANEGWNDYVLPFAGGGLVAKESVVYLDFDYIEGLDLIDYAKEASETDMRSILAQVAKALKWSLEAGFSHGDIKPDNIYIESVGGKPKVRLFDFGEATVDPRSVPMKEDLRAYIDMCRDITHVTKKELLGVLDVGNSNNAVNRRGLANAYDRLADYWSAAASSHRGGARSRSRRKQKSTRKRSI